jgi:hypothetical protein
MEEEGVRKLAQVEARLQIGRHQLSVLIRRALHGGLHRHLPRIVHLHDQSGSEQITDGATN